VVGIRCGGCREGRGRNEGVGDRGEGADIAGFAGAFDAQWVGLSRHRVLSQWIADICDPFWVTSSLRWACRAVSRMLLQFNSEWY